MFQSYYYKKLTVLPTSILSTENSIRTKLSLGAFMWKISVFMLSLLQNTHNMCRRSGGTDLYWGRRQWATPGRCSWPPCRTGGEAVWCTWSPGWAGRSWWWWFLGKTGLQREGRQVKATKSVKKIKILSPLADGDLCSYTHLGMCSPSPGPWWRDRACFRP